MNDGEVKQRLDRLRDRRQVRAAQDSAGKGNRPGLRALLAAAATAPAPAPEQATESGGGRLPGGLGAIAHLLKNPDIRHALLQWLQNQESGAGRGAGGENAWGLEFGADALPRAEELSTSSTLEEIARYYQQLESRTDWLESALEETLLELDRVSRFKLAASTPEDAGQPLAPPVDPMP